MTHSDFFYLSCIVVCAFVPFFPHFQFLVVWPFLGLFLQFSVCPGHHLIFLGVDTLRRMSVPRVCQPWNVTPHACVWPLQYELITGLGTITAQPWSYAACPRTTCAIGARSPVSTLISHDKVWKEILRSPETKNSRNVRYDLLKVSTKNKRWR